VASLATSQLDDGLLLLQRYYVGFIGLDLVFLAGMKWLITIIAVDLIVCALSAWYMMAHIIFLQVFGRDVLPVGKPWILLNGAAHPPKGEVLKPTEA